MLALVKHLDKLTFLKRVKRCETGGSTVKYVIYFKKSLQKKKKLKGYVFWDL